jgi:alkylated DNA nucleotide flippase Atl1
MAHRGDTSGRREAFAPRDDWGPALGFAPSAVDRVPARRDPGTAEPSPDHAAPTGSRRDAVLERIRATPPGFVRTYGDVSPGAPRFAGTVLAAGIPADVPWFRIVRADGSIATHPPARQRELLEREGVPFRGEKVDMKRARLP